MDSLHILHISLFTKDSDTRRCVVWGNGSVKESSTDEIRQIFGFLRKSSAKA